MKGDSLGSAWEEQAEVVWRMPPEFSRFSFRPASVVDDNKQASSLLQGCSGWVRQARVGHTHPQQAMGVQHLAPPSGEALPGSLGSSQGKAQGLPSDYAGPSLP